MSEWHVHELAGCSSTPLAAYLKALGVLRLVVEQADAAARGAWRGGKFRLATTLDRAQLRRFFLDAYAPSPILAPWNGGSGFYPKDRREAIEAIERSQAARFAPHAAAITETRAIVGERTERPSGDDKTAFIRRCRAEWRGPALQWIDAAVAITSEERNEYPALLGTGGNDGRLDYTNNLMQRLVDLIDPETGVARASAEPLLDLALFGEPAGGLDGNAAIGQFFPGAAGGANSTAGLEGNALVNPWDFVLMLEGALVLEVAVVRRIDGHGLPRAAAPFAVDPQAAGHGSVAPSDEDSRGEQWLPLWDGAATLAEVSALFAEGRMQTGTHRARRAVDAARAIARVGVARGVSGFERYGYVERFGQSNLAVPLGYWQVEARPEVRALDDIASWVERLRRAGRSDTSPDSIARSARRLEGAMMAVCRDSSRDRWESLVQLLAETEDELVRRPASTASTHLSPLPRLSAAWLRAISTEDAEVRLALAIASQSAPDERRRPRDRRLGSIRRNCLPLTPFEDAFAVEGGRLSADPEVVWRSRDTISDLTAVGARRLVDAARVGAHAFPLASEVGASPSDIAAFVAGDVNDARLGRLARAFMALDWRDEDTRATASAIVHGARMRDGEPVAPDQALFRLAYLPWRDGPFHAASLDPASHRLLASGRLQDAASVACRRLVALGWRPRLELVIGSPARARRLAASLAIPIRRRDVAVLHRAVCKPALVEPEHRAPAAND